MTLRFKQTQAIIKSIILILLFQLYVVLLQAKELKEFLETHGLSVETKWSLNIPGEVVDIEVSKDGSRIYVAHQTSNKLFLTLTNSMGNIIWEKEIYDRKHLQPYILNLSISDGGNIVVYRTIDGPDEVSPNWVFNNEGILLFHKYNSKGIYFVSPSGKYLDYMPWNDYSPLVIYTLEGKKIKINDTSFLKGGRTVHRFISEDRLLVYENYVGEGWLHLISVPDGKLYWSKTLPSALWLIDIYQRNVDYSDDYIVIQGTSMPATIFLLNMKGELIWENDYPISNHAIRIAQNNNCIISLNRNKEILVFNLKNGKIINNITFPDDNYGYIEIDRLSKFLYLSYFMKYSKEKNGYNRFSYLVDLENKNFRNFKGVLQKLNNTYLIMAEYPMKNTNSIIESIELKKR